MKTYLITGGAGFIGANLVRELVNTSVQNACVYNTCECKIYLLVEKNSDLWRLQDILEYINFIDADLTNYDSLLRQIKIIKPDVIFHLASFGGLPTQLNQKLIFDVNFYGTVNLLNACKHVGFDCFINTGSSSEYGMKNSAMSEDDVLSPISDYGVAKAAATQFCLKESLFNKLPVYTVRPFSVYGDFEMPGRLIPSILVGALQDRQINLSSPDFVRDFIYIKDFVDFFISLASVKPTQQYIFNAGTGIQSSIKNVTDTVQLIMAEQIAGYRLNICWGASTPRPWEPKRWQAKIDKALEFVGWAPKYLLKNGLTESIKWFDKNINFYVKDYERKSGSNIFTRSGLGTEPGIFTKSGKADQACNS
jgi:nucleoside-diphosphate-sugar epimerase